jgi:pimeloyl-ACP methyl ester carboxylesterase
VNESFEFIARDGTRLLGSLRRPVSNDPAPAALLISGSGPLDRDSNMEGQALNVGHALASALAARGVVSLRYDKRGVGESGGDYLTTGFDQETSDASAALEVLRAIRGIDRDRLTAVGHSVGATIAIRLASTNSWLAGAVLLSGSSKPGAEVMRRQSERIAASMRGPSRLFSRRFLRRQERARRLLLASTGDIVRIGRNELPARWFREYMAYDPAPDLRAIHCPVLAITGRNDIQVDPEDVVRIGQIVAAPFAGHTPEGLTHILRKHPGPPSLATYPDQLEKPVDADLLEQVSAWIVTRIG